MAQHIVQQGECIQRIAARHGMSAEELWQHADNEALRSERSDPNVLLPGDVVHVPDTEPRRLSLAKGTTNKFEARVTTSTLRFTVRGPDGPQANAAYTFELPGRAPVEGTTDGNGVATLEVPITAPSGMLLVQGEDHTARIRLRFGDLNPSDHVTGAQQRLRNLGFDCGRVDGRAGDRTRAAVSAFQAQEGLPQTGDLDEDTRRTLEERHGS